ncbi:MAG: DUF3098 domain-containing protein [Flavobacteriaceae bacterium]|nr:MAG: DUF3098 domain-containing protein [Flavobacteriaceae bacterium]
MSSTQTNTKAHLFGSNNYKWMWIGLGLIFLGFALMTGADANTRPDGEPDSNYFNPDIFSFTRIRLAPFLVLLGFGVEVYAILLKKK